MARPPALMDDVVGTVTSQIRYVCRRGCDMADGNPTPPVVTKPKPAAAQKNARKSIWSQMTLGQLFMIAIFILIIATALVLLQSAFDGVITAFAKPFATQIAQFVFVTLMHTVGYTGTTIFLFAFLFLFFWWIWRDARKDSRKRSK
jgi:hypothetical protein